MKDTHRFLYIKHLGYGVYQILVRSNCPELFCELFSEAVCIHPPLSTAGLNKEELVKSANLIQTRMEKLNAERKSRIKAGQVPKIINAINAGRIGLG